jgi:hypothetical protein
MRIKNFLIKTSVQGVLSVSAWMAKREWLNPLTNTLMTSLATTTIRSKGIREANSLAELGQQWQRGFPSAKQVPINNITEDTVYAEIHTPCPLRGTGDVHACYRMMAYDREVVKKAGGQFIVLSSQATPGNSFCRVAMRKRDADISDLKPAHEQKTE